MTDLLAIPYQDDFETTLSQAWNGIATTIYVNAIPTATTPAGLNYSYIVVDPGKSNMQVRKVTAWSGGTLTVTTDTIAKGSGTNYSAQSHASGAVVRFSNNYQFWADIQTAINSKADSTDLGDFTFSGDDLSATGTTMSISQTGSNFRIRRDGNDMKFRDDNTAETSLATIVAGAGSDQYVKVTSNDTTSGLLDNKLTAGDGLKKTVIDPAGNESLDLDVDTADTTTFVKTSSGAADENKVPVLNASGKLADGFIYGRITDNSHQAGENLVAGECVYLLDSDNKLYKTDADDATKISLYGIVTETVSAGGYPNVVIQGIESSQSSLTPYSMYYLSGTAGGISSTPGTNKKAVGLAISATKILVQYANELIWAGSDFYICSLTTERTTTSTSYVLKKSITIPEKGFYRISYGIKNVSDGITTTALVYRNASPYGTAQTHAVSSYATKTEYLWFNKGDVLDLYIKTSNGSRTAYVNNFYVTYSSSGSSIFVGTNPTD